MMFDDIEVEICDRCGECFSWHGAKAVVALWK